MPARRGCTECRLIEPEPGQWKNGLCPSCKNNFRGVQPKPSVAGSRFIDLAGKTFGRLKVMECAGRKWGEALWRCRCECGVVRLVIGKSLRSHETTSCGCARRLKDITGRTFARFTVLRRAESIRQVTRSGSRSFAAWICRCACGTEKVVRATDLLGGKSKSCGCLWRETVANLPPDIKRAAIERRVRTVRTLKRSQLTPDQLAELRAVRKQRAHQRRKERRAAQRSISPLGLPTNGSEARL